MAVFWVFIGAGFGAVARWLLSIYTPLMHGWLPLGTLAANAVGGLLMGVFLATQQSISPDMRLLLATGFLGGLTTFSTFSAETFLLFNQGKLWLALALISLHVILSVGGTAIGFVGIKTMLYGG